MGTMLHNEQSGSGQFEQARWQTPTTPFSMDPETGCIDFHEAHVTLFPAMPETEFRNGCPNAEVVDAGHDDEWRRYSFRQRLHDEQYLGITVYFREEKLKCVSFGYMPEADADWSKWSPEREQERAGKFQDELTRQLGKIGSFAWGSANAGFDSKGGASSIWVVYAG